MRKTLSLTISSQGAEESSGADAIEVFKIKTKEPQFYNADPYHLTEELYKNGALECGGIIGIPWMQFKI